MTKKQIQTCIDYLDEKFKELSAQYMKLEDRLSPEGNKLYEQTHFIFGLINELDTKLKS